MLALVLVLAACSSSPPATAQAQPRARPATPKVAQSTPTPTSQFTYVAIGASDTYGIGADDPSTENWAADLSMKLGTRVHLVNLGIPGVILHQALQVELPIAVDSHPQLITVWLAVNDIIDKVPPASYAKDLDLLLSRLHKAAPHTPVLIANVPEITLLPRFSGMDLVALSSIVHAYNTIISTTAKKYGVLVVDLYALGKEMLQHPEYISNDGLHPSTLGYARIADLFYQILQQHKKS